MREEKETQLVPSNPLLNIFMKKKKQVKFPEVVSPRRAKFQIKLKFEEHDLKISNEIVPEDADRLSAEYRTKIRAHYDKLKISFLT